MGLFDKIGDVIGDVVDGVVDFVDDVFNIDLKKVLNNDIVRYGLMAASIFTGGVAIANGVMTGFTQATAAKGFMNKFVQGAAGFVKGVAQGFTSPVDTASELVGSAKEALGAGSQAASQISSAVADPGMGSDLAANMSEGAVNEALGASQPDFNLADIASGSDPTVSNASRALGIDPTQANTGLPQSTDVMAPNFQVPGNAPQPNLQMPGNAPPSAFERMIAGIKGFAMSPSGAQTILGGLQGYAQGAMQQELLDQQEQRRQRRARSWVDRQEAPRTFGRIPSLQDLRAQVRARGDAAQAKYGY